MLPKISIVVPNYNGGRFLRQCLISLIEQEYEGLEIIVIDGGSSDDSLCIIKEFESSITYWVSEEDSGPASALSKGFGKASGQWLGWLNSDDLLLPGAIMILSRLIPLVESKTEWIIGSRLLINEQGFAIDMQNSMQMPELVVARDPWGIPQEATFFSRWIYDSSGGIDTGLRCHFDLDLFLRFYRINRPAYSSSVFGSFRQRRDQISRNTELSNRDYDQKINSLYRQFPLHAKIVRRLTKTRFRALLRTALHSLLVRGLLVDPQTLLSLRYDLLSDSWYVSCGYANALR